MAQTNPSNNSTHNEDTQIDFKHIVPQWFERLNKLLFEKVMLMTFYGSTIPKLIATKDAC